MPHPETWLKPTPAGLYCEPGGFFVDPLRAVDRAVITHAHSDHIAALALYINPRPARPGFWR